MEREGFNKIELECDDLERLYIPDVVYAEYSECKRHLQLIIPNRYEGTKQEKYPLILFIPGSAWYRQEVYNSIPSYSKLAERGIVTAILQYRESKIAHFPAQLQDTKAAIRFLITRAEEFHIDVNRIYVAGNSSGGHIALLTALTNAHEEFDTELYPEISFEIKGVIAESAPTDIMKCVATPIPSWFPEDFRPSFDLLGVKEIEENNELAKAASCEKYITKETKIPPILLFHGTEDRIVSVEQSRSLFELLTNFDKEVEYFELIGWDHDGPIFWTKEIIDIIDRFIKR